MVRHFPQCDLCGAHGHRAKDCGLNRLEEQRDPLGELIRKEGYRQRERERQIRKQIALNLGSAQSSRSFGL